MGAKNSEDDTVVRDYKDYAAPLIGIAVLVVVVLGLSAYWWRMTDVSECSSEHLNLSLQQFQGAAGTTYVNAVLTNVGKGSCLIDGYPAVFLTGEGGNVLGLGAASNPQYLPTLVTLAHGSSAHSVLAFPDAANFNPGDCSAASQFIK